MQFTMDEDDELWELTHKVFISSFKRGLGQNFGINLIYCLRAKCAVPSKTSV